MTEQNRKTLRSFYCRDYLWELFEVMARDLGCSMDYLINEAMRHYARSRNYTMGGQGAGLSQHGAQQRQLSTPGFVTPPGFPRPQPPPMPGFDQRTMSQAQTGQYSPAPGQSGPLPIPGQPAQFPPPPQAPSYVPAAPGFDARRPAAPPPPPAASFPPPMAAQGERPPLWLVFQGQKYLINKDKFIIGRGTKMTDLTIRDGNISRKHAAVIYRGGKYFIKDLDSTNGIDYQGSRIDSKKIEEGDVFHLCDYEIKFTYRG